MFKESGSSNNSKQQEIFEKINEYSKNAEFSNYLVYIMNNTDNELKTRQLSGLTLKGIMERSFNELTPETLQYFKENIFTCYLDSNNLIRKTIANLINTFVRLGGLQNWPELIQIISQYLQHETSVELALETLTLIIEDSGNIIDEKYLNVAQELVTKLISFLEVSSNQSCINNQILEAVLSTVNVLFEICIQSTDEFLDILSKNLINLNQNKNATFKARNYIARCWLCIIKRREDIFFNSFSEIISFFADNLHLDDYDLHLTSGEFFFKLVDEDEEGEYYKNEEIMELIKNNLAKLLPHFLQYTILTANDMCSADIENKQYNQVENNQTGKIEELDSDNLEMYNPNWTLRKCSSKLLDRLATMFPLQVCNILIPYLESDLMSKDWEIRERSILTLGAIGKGAYASLKATLQPLIKYLINELSHGNKLVRAISCWTLSRFSTYIMVENRNGEAAGIMKKYFAELLKTFMDKESIVQEASMTAFLTAVSVKKEKLTPYLSEIFQIINTVLPQYSGNSLLTLYEVITQLCENFEDEFKNTSLSEEVILNLLRKWYESVTSPSKDLTSNEMNFAIFDVICSIIKVSGFLMRNYFSDILNFSLSLIANNFNEKDLITKCLDILSALCLSLPDMIREDENRFKIVDMMVTLFNNYQDDAGMKQYLFPMVGDICRVDASLLESNIDYIINILIQNIQLPEGVKPDLEQISICNNSCWAIGVISITFQEKINSRIDEIMTKILKVLNKPKMNKSLAQNICICIGRLGSSCTDNVAKYLDLFIKQFCLSLKSTSGNLEKQQAFEGLCQVIIKNPQGVLNFFAFFCDCICNYEDAPFSLETLFHNIIQSFVNLLQEQWNNYMSLFPEKLKNKLFYRFSLKA